MTKESDQNTFNYGQQRLFHQLILSNNFFIFTQVNVKNSSIQVRPIMSRYTEILTDNLERSIVKRRWAKT